MINIGFLSHPSEQYDYVFSFVYFGLDEKTLENSKCVPLDFFITFYTRVYISV